ncbi:terminal uridylyltransferase 7 isoform X2 [Drosophila tropicalis]
MEPGDSERIQLQQLINQSPFGKELDAILYFYVAPRAKINECINDVCILMREKLGSWMEIKPFGSIVTGLSLKNSDIDLYMEWNGKKPKSRNVIYNQINGVLRSSMLFDNVFAIRSARVPIIRCRHMPTDLSIDINVANPKSIYNSRFVAELFSRDLRLRQLNLFLKIWAKKSKINGHGSMTSYCLCVLVVYYLQQRDLLPSIKNLQSTQSPSYVWGVNYAYDLKNVPLISNDVNIFDLIRGFFKFYSTLDFESILISPYLGYAINRQLDFLGPHAFPDYYAQMSAIERVTGTRPEQFQMQRTLCIQDPFELDHNVAKGVSKANLKYIQLCFTLAADACDNANSFVNTTMLYDYLLFGLLEKLEQSKLAKHMKPNQSSLDNTKHSFVLSPCTNDIKALTQNVQMKMLSSDKSIYSHWLTCQIETIKDVLTEVYELEMKVLDVSQKKEFPYYYMWQISTTLDTWKDRNFTHLPGKSFYHNQRAQTDEFVSSRRSVRVDLKGYFIMKGKQDMRELRIEVRPLPGDTMTMTKNGNLSRFFKSLKNFLTHYGFAERISIWQSLQPMHNDDACESSDIEKQSS